MLDSCKMVEKQSEAYVSVAFFPSLKQNFTAYRPSSRPNYIFEIHQLWQSGFSRVYSNWCCSCSFEAEIIKIGQSSHKMYSNKILNFQESTTILKACSKKVWKSIEGTTYIYIYIYVRVCVCVLLWFLPPGHRQLVFCVTTIIAWKLYRLTRLSNRGRRNLFYIWLNTSNQMYLFGQEKATVNGQKSILE